MKILCIDPDPRQLAELRQTLGAFPEAEVLFCARSAKEALSFLQTHAVDAVFTETVLTKEASPDCPGGIELAHALHESSESIRVVFVTSHPDYALSAFREDAVGYLLKPYRPEELYHELLKACRVENVRREVSVTTIPDFAVKVRGAVAVFNRPKVEELFALLIDRGDAGLTAGEAIAALWPDRPNDESTAALYRTTAKRLMEALREKCIRDIICTDGRRRYVDTRMVDCDLYRILAGDYEPLLNYHGEYLRRFSWAEDRNAWLWHLDREHTGEHQNKNGGKKQ